MSNTRKDWAFLEENELPGRREIRKALRRREERHRALLELLGAVVLQKLTGIDASEALTLAELSARQAKRSANLRAELASMSAEEIQKLIDG